MAKFNVLVTSWAVEEDNPDLERLRAIGCAIVNKRRPRHYAEAEIRDLIPGMDAVLAASDRYTPAVFEAADRLKVIARVGVGYDAVDLAAATRHGVVVSTTPGANHEAVAMRRVEVGDHGIAPIAAEPVFLDAAAACHHGRAEAGAIDRKSIVAAIRE